MQWSARRHRTGRTDSYHTQHHTCTTAPWTPSPSTPPPPPPAAGYAFPYLYDETQDVARAYRAACTPEFYVFDASLGLAYHGQFDDSRPKRDGVPATGRDLRAALDALLEGKPVPKGRPSIGWCAVRSACLV